MTQLARYPSLTGRGVVITGGATGIGEELVTQFVAQGAQVGFVDVDVSAGKALSGDLPATPRRRRCPSRPTSPTSARSRQRSTS